MFRFPVAAALLAAAAISASSCGDSTAPNGPAHVTIVAPEAKTASDGSLAFWLDDVVPLQATVTDRNDSPLTGQSIQWSSSDQSVVTVTSAGFAQAEGVGTASITATVGNVTTTIPVTVTVTPVSTVAVSAATSLLVGDSTIATATVTDFKGHVVIDRAVAWSSDHPEIASVTQTGWIVSHAAGSATISATSGGKTGSVQVTSTLKPSTIASVSFQLPGNQKYYGANGTPMLLLPDTSQIWVVVRDANGNQLQNRSITFSVDSPQVLDVTPSGLATSKGFGSGNVIINVEGILDSVPFIVLPSGLEVSRVNGSTVEALDVPDTIVAARSVTYAASVLDSNGNRYRPDNLTYSFVREYGSRAGITVPTDTVASPAPGTLGIRVTPDKIGLIGWRLSADGANGTAELVSRPGSIVTPDTVTVRVGDNISIAGQMLDADGNPVNSVVGIDESWQFDNTAIAQANGSGVVNSSVSVAGTAKAAGTTSITLDVYGTKKTVTVVVTP